MFSELFSNAEILDRCQSLIDAGVDITSESLREAGVRCNAVRLRGLVMMARRASGLNPKPPRSHRSVRPAPVIDPDGLSQEERYRLEVSQRLAEVQAEKEAEMASRKGGDMGHRRPRVYRYLAGE